jgi:hypothetical protein
LYIFFVFVSKKKASEVKQKSAKPDTRKEAPIRQNCQNGNTQHKKKAPKN